MIKLDETLDLDAIELHRRDDCKRYDKCLDDASIKRWRSFSCLDCQQFEPKDQETLPLRNASSLSLP